jgi:cytochrome o ubiquinol oxidase subunit 2
MSKLVAGSLGQWVRRKVGAAFLLMISLVLSGCDSGALAPKGEVAAAELKLIVFSAEIMLLVVLPVIFMALWFAWRYREKNNAKYTPEWKHSTILEIIWWTIPCIIILILGTVTWKTSHSLDPYKPLNSKIKPVLVEVVSLDWKWLFIYPEYKIATINYLKIPAGTPVNFKITAASPMNSFLIPQLGGQIYAMTGMTTQLHLMADEPGIYRGLATNYTGIGFSGMHFDTEAVSPKRFLEWVKEVQSKPDPLTSSVFWDDLMPKSSNDPVRYFGRVDEGLFDDIVMHYMMPSMSRS